MSFENKVPTKEQRLQERITSLENLIQQRDHEIADLHAKNSRTERKLLDTYSSQTQLETRDKEQKNQIQKLNFSLQVRDGEIKRLTQKLKETENELNGSIQVKNQYEQFQARYTHLSQKYNDIYTYAQKKLKESESSQKLISEELTKKTIELEETKKKHTEAQRTINDLSNRFAVREQSNVALQETLEKTKRALATLEQENNQISKNLKHFDRIILITVDQMIASRSALQSAFQSMEVMQKNTKSFFDSMEGQPLGPLTVKAARVIVEQWDFEILNLRKLTHELSGLIDTLRGQESKLKPSPSLRVVNPN